MSVREAAIYSFGDFHLNAEEPALLRHGTAIPLQLKALQTLIALVKRSGQLVTREELIDEIWPDAFVEENNLSQHIRVLRRSLGIDGHSVIETIPRRGYRFLPEVRILASNTFAEFGAEYSEPASLRGTDSLIGRGTEISKISELLRSESTRILTLSGVGGTGKTTLARAVGDELRSFFPDGVTFVELGLVTNADFVISVIAQSLGLKEGTSSTPIIEVLKGYLRMRRMLLIVDNFEQVLPAAPQLAELIQASPGLKILVTSRAALKLSAGREFVVPPLRVPESPFRASLTELSECGSVRLFVKRAEQARPGFELTECNADAVAQICIRLDGLPLAIELAAARVKIITPSLILEKLENRLKLLTGGAADLPARQQTIRGTVEWSYELLDISEKALFRRLSVFSGGFAFEMAETVMRGHVEIAPSSYGLNGKADPAEDLLNISILDSLGSLIDKSLIVSRELPDGTIRFRMLEVVREYGREALESAGELELSSRTHAESFLELAESAAPHLQGSDSVKWLDQLEEEHDNLRAALRWSLKNDLPVAARLAAALRFFWLFHTHILEGHKWMKETYEKSLDLPPEVRAKLLNGLGVGARIKGDYDSACVMHMEALYASTEAADKRETALSYRGLGAVAGRRGEIDAAQAFYESTLELSRELNDDSEIGYSLGSLGGLAQKMGDNARARALLQESLTTFRQLGQKERVTTNLFALGVIAYQENDLANSRILFEEAILIAQELGDKIHISDLLDGLAAVMVFEDPPRAARIAAAAATLRESIGYELAPAERLFRENYVSRVKASLDAARFDDLYCEGRKLTVAKAIELAVEHAI